MRSAPLFPIAHPRTTVAAPPPPGRGGLSAGFPPSADGSSVAASPPGAAADDISHTEADDLVERLRGVDWSVPAPRLPIDMPDEFPRRLEGAPYFTGGPFFDVTTGLHPTRDHPGHVDTFLAIALFVIATLAAVAIGLGLGWLAATQLRTLPMIQTRPMTPQEITARDHVRAGNLLCGRTEAPAEAMAADMVDIAGGLEGNCTDADLIDRGWTPYDLQKHGDVARQLAGVRTGHPMRTS